MGQIAVVIHQKHLQISDISLGNVLWQTMPRHRNICDSAHSLSQHGACAHNAAGAQRCMGNRYVPPRKKEIRHIPAVQTAIGYPIGGRDGVVDGGLLIRAEAGRMMVVHAPFCIDCQEKVKEAAGRHPILGTCYAGVTEYVFPLYAISGRTWGFICFSGFSQNPEASMERACAAAARFKIPKDKLVCAVNSLDTNIPDFDTLSAQAAPLQNMFTLLLDTFMLFNVIFLC